VDAIATLSKNLSGDFEEKPRKYSAILIDLKTGIRNQALPNTEHKY
jgi:hypothetical protein